MAFDPLDIRGQERDREAKALVADIEARNEEEDIKWLMGSRRGRRIVWRLLDRTGVYRLSFDTNALQMAFREGNRNFGNQILSMSNLVCPEHYVTMLKEHKNGNNSNSGGDPKSN